MTKKILITGISGFIGRNAKKYFSTNYEVFGLDIFGSEDKNFIQGEVDIDNLKKFNTKFDYILHFAGSSTVSNAQESPEVEYTKSVLSLKHLLDFCVENNPQVKIIFSSSAAVYGNDYTVPIKENFALNPMSVYGKHKVEAENLLKTYSEKYGTKSNILRLFSVYGEGLKKQVIWDFCNKVKNNFDKKELDCYGTGLEERDFIHINDVMQLVNLAMESPKSNLVINGGNGQATTIKTIFEKISQFMGYKGTLKFNNMVSSYSPIILVSDNSFAKSLNYKTQISIEEGLKNYVQWFQI